MRIKVGENDIMKNENNKKLFSLDEEVQKILTSDLYAQAFSSEIIIVYNKKTTSYMSVTDEDFSEIIMDIIENKLQQDRELK